MLAIVLAVLSTVGAVIFTFLLALPVFFFVTRTMMCETSTFDEAVSPNRRYKAAVVQVDCGAMTSSHRQVILVRRPFFWAADTVLYFNRGPVLHLSWEGRTLTVSGDRTLESMDRPPPDPLIHGGVLVRYSETWN